jgi:hypothetical protein
MTKENFYIVMMVLGTVLPWLFFAPYFAQTGFDIGQFVQSLFMANGLAAGFSTDILLCIGLFWLWSFWDAREQGIRHWWLLLPACSFVGLSLGLPLYLYLRETQPNKAPKQQA